jgi:uncharacterized cupredoxin-like copper-binding protein
MTTKDKLLTAILIAVTTMLFGCGKTPADNTVATNDKPENSKQVSAPIITKTKEADTSSEAKFEEEKIQFPRGATDVTLERTVAPGIHKTYLANAKKGQIMWFKVTESSRKIGVDFNKNKVKVGEEVRQELNASGEWAIYVNNPTDKPLKYTLWVGIE